MKQAHSLSLIRQEQYRTEKKRTMSLEVGAWLKSKVLLTGFAEKTMQQHMSRY